MRRGLGAYSLALAAVAVLVPLHRWWAAQVLLVPLLLIAPGSILLQALRIPSRVVKSFPVYVPCASIIVLFGSGLVVDFLGPLVGVAEPLRAVPLLVGFEIVCLGLVVAFVSARADVTIEWRAPRRPVRVALPLVLPLAAAAGAIRLNNNHSNAVAVGTVAVIVVMVSVSAALSARLDKALLEMVLYAAGLATVGPRRCAVTRCMASTSPPSTSGCSPLSAVGSGTPPIRTTPMARCSASPSCRPSCTRCPGYRPC